MGHSGEFARNHSGSVETKARPTACAVAARNLSGETTAGASKTQRKFARNHSGSVETQRNSRETTAGASKRNGIRAKPQRERRNATEFARNHSGSVETQRNSRETTAGASKRNGIRAKPQRERRNATEFARNHSGSVETQRNSRETTAGASKRNGIRAKPQRERRNAREFARNHSRSVETQGNSRETTAGASKPKRRSRPTAACAVAARHQFLYSQRKNPIVQALLGNKARPWLVLGLGLGWTRQNAPTTLSQCCLVCKRVSTSFRDVSVPELC